MASSAVTLPLKHHTRRVLRCRCVQGHASLNQRQIPQKNEFFLLQERRRLIWQEFPQLFSDIGPADSTSYLITLEKTEKKAKKSLPIDRSKRENLDSGTLSYLL